MISKTMQDALNAQIHLEQYSAQLYLAMSAHCAAKSFKGFAHWLTIQASEETEEMYSSIDLLYEKIERRVRKYKERLTDHKHQTGPTGTTDAAQTSAHPEDRIPQIIKTKRFDLKPMHPDEAVMQMELLDKQFFFFSNASSGHINVIYRRNDGNVGLIEPNL